VQAYDANVNRKLHELIVQAEGYYWGGREGGEKRSTNTEVRLGRLENISVISPDSWL
jgi:hypothetical protein